MNIELYTNSCTTSFIESSAFKNFENSSSIHHLPHSILMSILSYLDNFYEYRILNKKFQVVIHEMINNKNYFIKTRIYQQIFIFQNKKNTSAMTEVMDVSFYSILDQKIKQEKLRSSCLEIFYLFPWTKFIQNQKIFDLKIPIWKVMTKINLEEAFQGIKKLDKNPARDVWENIAYLYNQQLNIDKYHKVAHLLIKSFFKLANLKGQKKFFKAICYLEKWRDHSVCYSPLFSNEFYLQKIFSAFPTDLKELHFVAPKQIKMNLLNILCRQCPKIEYLMIQSISNSCSYFVMEKSIESLSNKGVDVFKRVINLKLVKMSIDNQNSDYLVRHFPYVTSLKINYSIIGGLTWELITQHMKYLEVLDLSYSKISPLENKCKKLKNTHFLSHLRELTLPALYAKSLTQKTFSKLPNLSQICWT